MSSTLDTIRDLIVWDDDGFASLPDDAQVPCDNPYDWRPIDGDTIPAEEDPA